MYRPTSFVVVLRDVLVATSVSVTAAPETTAPDWSLTVPATVPVALDCAHIGRALPMQITTRRNRASFTLRMCYGSSAEFSNSKTTKPRCVRYEGFDCQLSKRSVPTTNPVLASSHPATAEQNGHNSALW